jgi:DNA polymerase III gamma/tau subunit
MEALAEKYRPRAIAAFVGLPKPKTLCARLAAAPYASAWLFCGPSGTGKTTMALALAAAVPAELHHIPSQECNVENIARICARCQYVPMAPYRMHLVLIDEADQMSNAAQIALLSRLDSTNPPPNTIFVLTCNDKERFQARLLSRTRTIEFSSYGIAKDAVTLLEEIWRAEAPATATLPNFARIVKDANNNVREALMNLEMELLAA